MAYGRTHKWAQRVPENNGEPKKNISPEIVALQAATSKYDNLSKIELAAVRAIHKYDPSGRGHGPNGPLFDELWTSLVPGVANISRPELYDILTGLNGAGYIHIDPINSTYSLTDRGKNLI